MKSLARESALGYDGRDFTYADLVLAGILDGCWPALEARTADQLAAVEVMEAANREIDPADVKAALVAFRRGRGLIAGDDFRAWREARELTSDDLNAYFERELAPERVPHDLLRMRRPEPAAIAAVMRVQAYCSGMLEVLARTLVMWAAGARGLEQAGADQPEPDSDATAQLVTAAHECVGGGLDALSADELQERAAAIATLYAAFNRFATGAAAADKVDRAIASHGLGWQHFRWTEAAFASESAAREALMLVREDGMDFAEVAQMAGSPPLAHDAYFDDLGKEIGGILMSTPPGSLAGPLPLEGNGAWRLLAVEERTLADAGDPVLRKRAEDELVNDALERHLVGRVQIHVQL